MIPLNDLVTKKISVDIGDLQVEFWGSSQLLSPRNIRPTPLHLHSKHEFQYIISGALQESIDGNSYNEIQEDSVLLIPPNMLHSNPACDCQRLVATMVFQQLPNNNSVFSEYTHYCEIFGAFREPMVFQDPMITHYVRQFISLSDGPESDHKRKSLLAMLFISLADYIKKTTQASIGQYPFESGTQYNQQYFLTDHYINSHYSKKTSIQELADYLHVSRRQADRIVYHIFGKTYAELILLRRMSIAQMLLQKTDMPCAKVAEKVGYGSYAGFYIAFQKHFGIAPEEMRNEKLPANK